MLLNSDVEKTDAFLQVYSIVLFQGQLKNQENVKSLSTNFAPFISVSDLEVE